MQQELKKPILEKQETIVEQEEINIPNNVWCINAETKTLIVSEKVKKGTKIILIPKVAGG